MDNYPYLLPTLCALLSATLALIALWRNPGRSVNVGFAFGMASFASMEAGAAFVLSPSGGLKELGAQMHVLGASMLPAAWLVFSTVYGRKLTKGIKALIAIFFIAGIAFSAGAGSSLFISPAAAISGPSGADSALVFGPAGKYLYWWLILGLVVNLVFLENTLRSVGRDGSKKMKYVIIPLASVLAFLVYFAGSSLASGRITAGQFVFQSALTGVFSIVMAILVVRKKLLDVDVSLSRNIVYNTFTLLAAGAYLISIGIATEGIRQLRLPFDDVFIGLVVFSALLALSVSLSGNALGRNFEHFISKNFFKTKYEFRDKWLETTNKVGSKTTVDEVAATLSEMLSASLGTSDVIILLYDRASDSYAPPKTGTCEKVGADHAIIKRLKSSRALFLKESLKADRTLKKEDLQAIRKLFSDTGTSACAPLLIGSELTGFLLISRAAGAEPFSAEDVELVNLISAQTAMRIKNIRLADEVLAAKEAEVFHRMSSFIMHDLKNLTNSLSLVSQNARHNLNNIEFQKDSVKTIDSIVERMKRLMERLKEEPCEPSGSAEINLIDALDSAIKRLGADALGKLTFANAPAFVPVLADKEALETVFFNLLANASESTGAEGFIKIECRHDGESVLVKVSDNGTGMSREYLEKGLFRPFSTTKKHGFGIGLYQCKTIIEAHGGRIEVQSVDGKGASFTVRLPALRNSLAV